MNLCVPFTNRGQMGVSCAIIPKNVAAAQQREQEGESRQFLGDESKESSLSSWTNLL